MSALDSPTWATLRSWIGSGPKHPLRELVAEAEHGGDSAIAACDLWEELLRRIEEVQPTRWVGKRREFRGQTSFDETFAERSELLLAKALADADVAFEFGKPGQPQPDLVLPEWNLGIEVGSRVVDGVQQLENDIRAAVETNSQQEHIRIVFDVRPLVVRKQARLAIVEQFLQGMDVDYEVVPSRGNQPAVHVRIVRTPSPEGSTVVTSFGSALLSPHQKDVVVEIRSKIVKNNRKIAQAESMPTILAIDIARCGLAWLVPLAFWEDMLHGFLDKDDPYVAVAVMVADLSDNSVRLAWAMNSHHGSEATTRVDRLFAALTH